MPTINREISLTRGHAWLLRNLRYRASFDQTLTVAGTRGWGHTTFITWRYAIDIRGGKSDTWYSRQAEKVPQLLMFPKEKAAMEPGTASLQPLPQDPELWFAAHPRPDSFWLISAAELAYYENPAWMPMDPNDRLSGRAVPERKAFFPLADFRAVADPAKTKQTAPRFADLAIGAAATQLVIYAAGIERGGLAKLNQILQSHAWRKLAIMDAGIDTSAVVVDHLSPQLEELNLAHSVFNGVHLGKKIRAMKNLRVLNLHNTTMDRQDFSEILLNLPASLEELHLGWQNNPWDAQLAEGVSRLALPKLRILDLENCGMDDRHLKPVLLVTGEALEELNISLNFGTSDGLQEFLRRPHPKLRQLNLASTALSFLPGQKLDFPASVQELDLSFTDLNSARLANLHLPTKLRSFSAIGNELTDADIDTLLPRFAPQMDALLLGGNKLEGSFLKRLSGYRIGRIDAFGLSKNPLREESLVGLAQSRELKVRELFLDGVPLGTKTAKHLLTAFGPELEDLNLCETLVTGDVLAMLHVEAPVLRNLSLCNILGLDANDLSALPRRLVSLNLSGNRLSDAMLEQVATHLPKSLRSLNLDESRFSAKGISALVKHLPPLYTLVMGSPDLDDASYQQLATGLPRTLRSISLRGGKFSEKTAKILAQTMPPFLRRLSIADLDAATASSQILVDGLPPTLRSLIFQNFPFGVGDGGNGSGAKNLRNVQNFSAASSDSVSSQGIIALMNAPAKALFTIAVNAGALSADAQTAIAQRASLFWSLSLRSFSISPVAFKELKAAGIKNLKLLEISNFNWADMAIFSGEDFSGLHSLTVNGAPLGGKELIQLLTRLTASRLYISLVSTKLKLEDVDALIAALPPSLRSLRVFGNDIGRAGIAKFRLYKEKFERETGYALALIE